LSTGINITLYSNNYFEGESKTTTKWFLKPSAGVAWWINDNVSLNLSAGYYFLNYVQEQSEWIKLGVGFKFWKPKTPK